MTLAREEIVRVARGWLGTPYRHQASCKGAGTDCLGLIRGVWREVMGAEPERAPPYTPDWAEALGEETLLEAARRNMWEVAPGDARAGDVLLFRMGLGAPAKHAAIVTEMRDGRAARIIHAYWGKAVCETELVPWWRRRIVAAFEWRAPDRDRGLAPTVRSPHPVPQGSVQPVQTAGMR